MFTISSLGDYPYRCQFASTILPATANQPSCLAAVLTELQAQDVHTLSTESLAIFQSRDKTKTGKLASESNSFLNRHNPANPPPARWP